jgi:hypothetical protein
MPAALMNRISGALIELSVNRIGLVQRRFQNLAQDPLLLLAKQQVQRVDVLMKVLIHQPDQLREIDLIEGRGHLAHDAHVALFALKVPDSAADIVIS